MAARSPTPFPLAWLLGGAAALLALTAWFVGRDGAGAGWFFFGVFGFFPALFWRRARPEAPPALPRQERLPLPAAEDWTPERTADDAVDAAPVPRAAAAPAPPAPAAEAPPPPAAVPEPLADLAEPLRRAAATYTRLGRGRFADALEEAWGEAVRLARLRDALGDLAADAAAARAEAEAFAARAAAATDTDARAEWTQSAALAERRAAQLDGLRAVADRSDARLAGFRQVVRSAALDAARLEVAAGPGPTLGDLAASAAAVELEVEALHRTADELRRLSRPPGGLP